MLHKTGEHQAIPSSARALASAEGGFEIVGGAAARSSPAYLPCPHCSAPIELSSARWCGCLSKSLSLVCLACKSCFCKMHNYPHADEWQLALRGLREREAQEKFRRALQASPAGTSSASTVLIVDDDEEIRLIAEYTLREMGYNPLLAADAAEALMIVEKHRPDIVLTDALMPKVDGRQLCHLIKIVDPTIKVIVMSAVYTNVRYRSEAIKKYQADEFLAKPIDFHQLHDVLQHLSGTAS